MASNKYRFFFHYRKVDGRMSVHFRNQCIPIMDVVCEVPVKTKRNKRQPYLVLIGYAKEVLIEGETAYIR